jgi:hypothetical protein
MIIYLNLKIVHSNTAQYRQGNEVYISKFNTVACPLIQRWFTSERATADAPPDRK